MACRSCRGDYGLAESKQMPVGTCGRGGKKVNLTCISPVRSLLTPASSAFSVVAEDNSFTSGPSHRAATKAPAGIRVSRTFY